LRTEGRGIQSGHENGLNISSMPAWLKVLMASAMGRASLTWCEPNKARKITSSVMLVMSASMSTLCSAGRWARSASASCAADAIKAA
jgi:hypothetical protein